MRIRNLSIVGAAVTAMLAALAMTPTAASAGTGNAVGHDSCPAGYLCVFTTEEAGGPYLVPEGEALDLGEAGVLATAIGNHTELNYCIRGNPNTMVLAGGWLTWSYVVSGAAPGEVCAA